MSEDRPEYDARPINPVVRALNEPFVKLYPSFAREFGGLEEAVLLQHLIDWTRKSPDGWVYRTQAEIEEATSISTRRQYDALQRLKEKGAVEVKRIGIPAKNWYRVNGEAITGAVTSGTSSANSPILPSDPAELAPPTRRSLKEREEEIERIDPTLSGSGSDARKRKASRMTETWTPGEMAFAWCELSEREVARQLELFRDHFLGTGKPMIDWNATWRKWLRRAQDEFAPRQPARRQPPAADRLFAYAQQLREQEQ